MRGLLLIGQRFHQVWRADLCHDDLIGKHLPRLALFHRGLKSLTQPVFLNAAEHGAAVVADPSHHFARLGGDGIGRRAGKLCAPGNLVRPAGQARFETEDACGLTEVEGAVDTAARTAGLRVTDRHPLKIGLDSSLLAVAPVSLRLWLVVLSAGPVGVVRALMIVPGADPGGHGMRSLQHRICLVLGMTHPVVAERHNFHGRLMIAADFLARLTAIAVDPILIDIVAKVDDRVEVAPLGNGVIDVEIAKREIRAGDDGEFHRRLAGSCSRAGTGDRGGHIASRGVRCELVEVFGVWLQTFHIRLEREVARSARIQLRLSGEYRHGGVGADAHRNRDRRLCIFVGRRHARPDNDPVAQRIA